MTALLVVAAGMFVVGLFTRDRLRTGQPVARVYTLIAAGTGVFAAMLGYLLGSPAWEALGTGLLWALVVVAVPFGNLVRDRAGRPLR